MSHPGSLNFPPEQIPEALAAATSPGTDHEQPGYFHGHAGGTPCAITRIPCSSRGWPADFHKSRSVYSLGMRLITILEDLVNAIFGGQVLAALSQLHGADDADGLSRNFLRLSHLTAAFCAGSMGMVLWISEAFLRRWVGGDSQPGSACHMDFGSTVCPGFDDVSRDQHDLHKTGKSHWMAILTFATEDASALLLSVVLGFAWGLKGVVLGSAIAMLVERGIFVPWLLGRCASIRPARYMLLHVLRPAVFSVAPAVLFAWLSRPWLTPAYSHIFLLAAGYIAVFLLTAPWLALDAPTSEVLLWRILPWPNSSRAAAI